MVFLDANILLELILPDRLNQKKVEAYLRTINSSVCISVLTAHLILYFGAKNGLSKEALTLFLSDYIIQDLTKIDYSHAMKIVSADDYEDALQLCVAIRSQCEIIITLDKDFARRYANTFQFKVLS